MAQEKKIIKLSVVRNKNIKETRGRVYRELKAAIKDIPDDVDGYALISYKRIPRDDGVILANTTNYSVLDPVDLAMLPQLTLMLLQEAIIKSSY